MELGARASVVKTMKVGVGVDVAVCNESRLLDDVVSGKEVTGAIEVDRGTEFVDSAGGCVSVIVVVLVAAASAVYETRQPHQICKIKSLTASAQTSAK